LEGIRLLVGSDFVRKFAGSLGSQAVVILCGVASGIVTARMLGPGGRGELALAAAIASLALQFGGIGFQGAMTYFVAKDRRLAPSLLGNALVFDFAVWGILALATATATAWLPVPLPVRWGLLVLVALNVPFLLGAEHLGSLLIGLNRVKEYNATLATTALVGLSLVGLAAVWGSGQVLLYYAATVAAQVATFGARWASLRREVPERPRLSKELFCECLPYGWKSFASGALAVLVQRVDLFMVEAFLGLDATGHYAIALSLVNMLQICPAVAGQIAFPRMVAMPTRDQRLAFAWKVAGLVLSLLVPASIAVAWIAHPLITTLYGPAFGPAARPFAWLAPGLVVWSLEVMFRRVLITDGFPTGIVWGWVMAVCLNIALNAALIPRLGLVGAGLASSLAYGSVALCTGLLLWRTRRSGTAFAA
jgi:O-antigen/teichoic acid export membrane protein